MNRFAQTAQNHHGFTACLGDIALELATVATVRAPDHTALVRAQDIATLPSHEPVLALPQVAHLIEATEHRMHQPAARSFY